MVSTYREVPQAGILDVAKTVLIMFGKDEDFQTINQQLVCEIINTTLQMSAQLNNSNNLAEKSDVLAAFFRLLAQISKKAPHFIVGGSVDTAALFQCGTEYFCFF